ncbi:hypothetical protein [Clostridium beijerinckii]|uniref:hypothetical protein n=1 Tax=Clostridium beijerinckii TaxID=1520 RepID=UPI001493E2E0|nr:hypothetical protein [Clostridium beijerinckii]NOW07246.1 hypothetical protein [Clostridium beijerinckii]NYC04980.1 hypothetical protein [Clostridium beijerinckii]
MVRTPNVKKDKFIVEKEVSVFVEGMPSFSFKDGKLYNDSFLHYNTKLYETSKNEKYYVFKAFDDCTLYIMNCNKEIYKALTESGQIELDSSISIFDESRDIDDNEVRYYIIPASYREVEGFGGMGVVMCQ